MAEAKVVVGVEGADEVAAAAGRATEPWKRAGEAVASSFKRAGSAIAGQLEQVGMDMLRTVTVMQTLDMRSAVAGARAYREEVTRFGTVAGESVGNLRMGFEKLSKLTLEGEPALAAWAKGVGRLTYDYVGAVVSAKALHDESVATGKSFDEMGQLGVVLHNTLGVTDNMEGALGKIRAQAEALGTVGGVAAFQDKIQALGGTLLGMATQTDEARNRITALVGVLGKDLKPGQAQQVQQGVLATLQARSYDISRSLGYDILNEKGEVADPTRVVRDVKRLIERTGRDGEERRLMARGIFGDLGGSAILRGDFSEQNIASLAATPASKGASRAAAQFAGSEAGQALKTQQSQQRSLRDTAETYLHMQDRFGAAFADSPIAGQMVGSLMQATMRAATQQVGGLFSGGGAGGGAAAAGGAGGAEEAAVALGGGLGMAAVALGTFTLAVLATGKVLMDLGEASAKKMGLGRPELLNPEEAKALADKAKAAEEAAPSERSEGQNRALELERARLRKGRALELVSSYEDAYRGQHAPRVRQSLIAESTGANADPVLKAVREQLESGRIDTKALPADIANALVEALSRSPIKAVLQADPTTPTPKKAEEGEQ